MDPNEIYDAPGKSKMGMDLVPVYEDKANGSGIVSIDPAVVQNMNVKTAVVESKKLSSEVVTNGVLTTNEKTEYIVTTRVNGWVENLYINYTGQPVAKGQKLMDIYSPELVAAQQELITALNYQKAVKKTSFDEVRESGDELLKNAIQKLRLLEIPESDIEKIKETKRSKNLCYSLCTKQRNCFRKECSGWTENNGRYAAS
ncbi:MAG: efflux RND transporter periplasmic adaptor subunit [Ignavibacteriaceae bacterium]|nr:efflux RND transporter periplasmic adaptor subunit [Ignavibacteriaceae bacterium]